MRRAPVPAMILMLVLLLGGGFANAEGATLYVARVLTVPAGSVSIGDIVRVVGQVPAQARELLLRTAVVASDKVLYVPASQYMEELESAFGNNAIVVGSRTLLIPSGTSAQSESYLMERLADYLESQGMVGSGITEITFTQGIARGTAPKDGTPVFRSQTSSRGLTEISFSLTDSAGSTVSGRASFASSAAAPSTVMRAGTAVQVVFRKGPIVIEMPGKALASAAAGQSVSVTVPDNQKTFTGQVIDAREVQVDLP